MNIASGDIKVSGGSVRLSRGKGCNSSGTLKLIGGEMSSSKNAVHVRTGSGLTSSSGKFLLEASNVAIGCKSSNVKIKTGDSDMYRL